MVVIIIVLLVLLGLSYLDYKIYDSKKVPKGTPTIIDDIAKGISKTSNSIKKKAQNIKRK